MPSNPYRPQAIELLSDATLLKTLRHYRDLAETIDGADAPDIRQIHSQLVEAVSFIEVELIQRGCAAYASTPALLSNPPAAAQ